MNFSKIRKQRLSSNVSYWKLFQIALFSPKKPTIWLPRKLKQKKTVKNLNKGQKKIEKIKKPLFWSSSYNLYYVIYFSQYFKTHSSKTHKTIYFWKPYWILKNVEKNAFCININLLKSAIFKVNELFKNPKRKKTFNQCKLLKTPPNSFIFT